jgi:hypothetical protein
MWRIVMNGGVGFLTGGELADGATLGVPLGPTELDLPQVKPWVNQYSV